MMVEDGAEFTRVLHINPDALARRHTAFSNLDELCEKHLPTLRIRSAPDEIDRLELRILADAYDARQKENDDPRRAMRG